MLIGHFGADLATPAGERARRLDEALRGRGEVHLFPDAADERWGIPTGVLIRFRRADALLFPLHLRDPGCGFLVFRLESRGLSGHGAVLLRTLHEWVHAPAVPDAAADDLLQRSGIHPDVAEAALAVRGFGMICNTLEIRRAPAPSADIEPFIGFLHTGVEGMCQVLENRFAMVAAEHSLAHRTFTAEEIDAGFFALPLASPQGEEYARWLAAATKLSRASRQAAFAGLMQRLGAFAVEHGLTLHLSPLFDRVHSGIEIEDKVVAFRGVQRLEGPTLIAGHRETAAALVEPGPRGGRAFVPHGTGPPLRVDGDDMLREQTLRSARAGFYDTAPDYRAAERFTISFRQMIEAAETVGVLRTVAMLPPWINVQGLKRFEAARAPHPQHEIGVVDLPPYEVSSYGGTALREHADTAMLVLNRNLPHETDTLCNGLIERSMLATPFHLFVLESGSERSLLSRYVSFHFKDAFARQTGLRIARGLNAGWRLIRTHGDYRHVGFLTNDVVLQHDFDTIGEVERYFADEPRLGVLELLHRDDCDRFCLDVASGDVCRFSPTGGRELLVTPYPIIRAIFLRREFLDVLGDEILCEDNWHNWGNDEDLGYQAWRRGWLVGVAAALPIREEAMLSTREHTRVKTETVDAFRREAAKEMHRFLRRKHGATPAEFRGVVCRSLLAHRPYLASRRLKVVGSEALIHLLVDEMARA